MKRLGLLLTATFGSFVILGPPLTSNAAAETFASNNIIADAVFDNTNTMTASQIDSWLNTSFGSASCISTAHGFTAPDPTGYNPTQGFLYGSNVSAGRVIYDAAQAYGINPQILLATLQKEQSLVDGSAGCSTLRYAAATGYGCPDGGTTYSYSGLNLYTINGATVTSVSGTCVNTALKAGFSQQIIRAAWLLRFGEQRSEGNINWAIVKGTWNNSDDPQTCYGGPMTQGTWQRCPSGGSAFYDGYTTIDSTSVHMDNGATASLYWYTPHFSGNQNFYTLFTNWFGSTHEEYSYAFESMVGSGAYTIPADIAVSTEKTFTVGSNLYTLYGDTKSHTLQLLHWNGTSWSKSILDGPGSSGIGSVQSNVDPTSIEAFAYNGSPQYFYTDTVTGTVRHGFIINGSYAVETLDGSAASYLGQARTLGSAVSGFTYGSDGIQLYYFDTTQNTLIHTWWNGHKWNTETLDGSAASYLGQARTLGSAVSGFTYGSDGIQLYYFDTTQNTLIHTWWNGHKWNTETLDGSAASYLGQARTLGSAVSGTPYGSGIQLFYYNTTSGDLIHTFILSGRWVTETMDGNTSSILGNDIDAGKRVQVKVVNDQVFVLYYDDATAATDGHTSAWRIIYTSKHGGGWIQGILDGGSIASKSGSAVSPILGDITFTGYKGTVQIFYADSSSYLRHAWLY